MTGKRIVKQTGNTARMNRSKLITALRSIDCDFEMDFTDEYLRSISLDRLRHLLMAAKLHVHNSLQCK